MLYTSAYTELSSFNTEAVLQAVAVGIQPRTFEDRVHMTLLL